MEMNPKNLTVEEIMDIMFDSARDTTSSDIGQAFYDEDRARHSPVHCLALAICMNKTLKAIQAECLIQKNHETPFN